MSKWFSDLLKIFITYLFRFISISKQNLQNFENKLLNQIYRHLNKKKIFASTSNALKQKYTHLAVTMES